MSEKIEHGSEKIYFRIKLKNVKEERKKKKKKKKKEWVASSEVPPKYTKKISLASKEKKKRGIKVMNCKIKRKEKMLEV